MSDQSVKETKASLDSQPPRKPYTSPRLERLGGLEELTQSMGNSGHKDSNRKNFNRTH